MFLLYFFLLHFTFAQEFLAPIIFSDCKHLILPLSCQCYHSGEKSQLRCHNIQLNSLPKLPNNMHWNALNFSFNHLRTIESYLFSDIYIEKLDFKYNAIETIELTAFEQVQNLKELFLDHNQLKVFDPKILISPGVSLEYLDLSFNPFEYLNLAEIFRHAIALKQFYAISSHLNNPSLYTLLNLTGHSHSELQLIDLSYNNLTSICKNLFDSFYNLIELRLDHNQILAIDNYAIYSLNYFKRLDLAYNSLEYLPNLFSSSLEYLNLSSNKIRLLSDYFAANLHSIRSIDFDSNEQLTSISASAFCFLNISRLEKLSFRSNNLSSIHPFIELLCRLFEHSRTILNLNENVYLQCDCMLVRFKRYLIDYPELTCAQQGQDRYFISKEENSFSNCTWDVCLEMKRKDLCRLANAEQLNLNGTCHLENQLEYLRTITEWKIWENLTENSTILYENRTQSNIGSGRRRKDCLWIFIVFWTFHRFNDQIK